VLDRVAQTTLEQPLVFRNPRSSKVHSAIQEASD